MPNPQMLAEDFRIVIADLCQNSTHPKQLNIDYVLAQWVHYFEAMGVAPKDQLDHFHTVTTAYLAAGNFSIEAPSVTWHTKQRKVSPVYFFDNHAAPQVRPIGQLRWFHKFENKLVIYIFAVTGTWSVIIIAVTYWLVRMLVK